MKRKAYFFSIDAFIAMIVISTGIFLIFFSTSAEPPKTNVFGLAEDLTNYLSATKIHDINDELYPYIKKLKLENNITDYSNTLMEQIGEFYIKKNLETAENFTKILTYNIVSAQYSYQVLVNRTNIYNKTLKSQKKASTIISSKTIIMGILNDSCVWGPLDAEVRIWY